MIVMTTSFTSDKSASPSRRQLCISPLQAMTRNVCSIIGSALKYPRPGLSSSFSRPSSPWLTPLHWWFCPRLTPPHLHLYLPVASNFRYHPDPAMSSWTLANSVIMDWRSLWALCRSMTSRDRLRNRRSWFTGLGECQYGFFEWFVKPWKILILVTKA